MNEMNIVFMSSNEYAEHMSVVMTSILLNNRNYHINFYVLTKDIQQDKKDKIGTLTKNYNCNINYIKIDDSIFKGIKPDFCYNSIETYFRLIIADVVNNIDKCIVIDIDTITNGSLQEFWEENINNLYAAAIKDLYAYNITNYFKDIKFNVKEYTYFNAGIMLLNLKEMRKDNIVPKLLSKALEIHKSVKFLDQDILNLVLQGKVKILDSIYNYTTTNAKIEPNKKDSWIIRHFNGPIKPWDNINNAYPDFYYYYYYKNFSPFNSKTKIFVIYHDNSPLFSTDVLTPIKTGKNNLKYKMLEDSSGDNIADRNTHYAELTANYWSWKNYLKSNPHIEYIGFCHYRRFLNMKQEGYSKRCFNKNITFAEFSENFSKNYTDDIVYNNIKDYDVILPELHHLNENEGTIYTQFIKNHPQKELEKLVQIIKNNYPQMIPDMDEFLNGSTGYFCLNYVMKTHLFDNFMNWTFDILTKLDSISYWNQYTDYLNQKTPAYLMERFFNVWLKYQIRVNHIKILNRQGILLKDTNKIYKILPGINIIHQGKVRILEIAGIKIKGTKTKNKLGSSTLKFGKLKFYKISKLAKKYLMKYIPKKNIKLVATLLVRDEIDIIEENLKFHLNNGVDFIIATDNGSTDGTRDVLLKYERRGVLKLIDEPEQNYNQVKWVDRMIRIAKKDYHADWIINLDADEFWYSDFGDLKKDLQLLDKYNVIYIPSLFMAPQEQEGLQFYHNTKGQFKALLKVIHRTRGYRKIEMGAHDVKMLNKKSTYYNGITLFHYFVRSYEQFEHKVEISGKALRKNKNLKKDEGQQMFYYYDLFLQNKLRDVFYKNFILKDNDPCIYNSKMYDYYRNSLKSLPESIQDAIETSECSLF